MSAWAVERSVGAAGPFHDRDLTEVSEASVWIHRVERPALVLGSSQLSDIVDRESATRLGVEVTGRRSGGGLVLVEPDDSCWIDVLIPPSSRLWHDDVNRAFGWVGEVWENTLTSLGMPGLQVHDGPLTSREHGRMLCFAGLGPGEVVQTTGSQCSKVVGLSQRRTRTTARFQGLLVTRWNPDLLLRLVRADAWPAGLDPSLVSAGLAPSGDGRSDLDLDLVPDAFLAALPDPGAPLLGVRWPT